MRRVAELRDYYGPNAARSTVLADYVGEREEWGPFKRATHRVVDANNKIYDALAEIPFQWGRDFAILRDPLERRLLLRSVKDEALLTDARRQSLISIIITGSALAWAIAGIAIALAFQGALPEFRATYTLFLYGVATSLFLPLPFETLLNPSVAKIGILWTVLVSAFAKVAGAGIVLLAGDRAQAGLDQTIRRYPKLQSAWRWLQIQARKYGYSVVFFMFAFPFMSDTLPLFLLAVMNMRKAVFLLVTFVAICVRCLLFIYAGEIIANAF